jgi:prefoldin subunit 5
MAGSIAEIARSIKTMARPIAEIAGSIKMMARPIAEIAGSIAEIAGSIAEMAGSIAKIARSIAKIARSIETMARSIAEIARSIAEMTGVIDRARKPRRFPKTSEVCVGTSEFFWGRVGNVKGTVAFRLFPYAASRSHLSVRLLLPSLQSGQQLQSHLF